MINKKFFLFFLIFFLLSPFFTLAQEGKSELENKITEIKENLIQLSQTRKTLKNEISYIESQISLTGLQITQTENSMDVLKRDIAELSLKISQLDIDLNQLSAAFILQTTQSYKIQKTLSPLIAFISGDFNKFLKQQKYLTVVQKNSQDTLVNMETVRTNYDLQKQEKAKKQEELEAMQQQLARQKINLASQKSAKNNLLSITQNDEKNYQSLLLQAQTQLAALRNFSKTYGNTCLASSPGGGSDDNFYSQRDPRWCTQKIGSSPDTIGEVGCFISSISMVYKKLGHNITPSAFASDPSNFLASTAYMVAPAPPAGYVYKIIKYYDSNIIDSELQNNRYVIAQIRMNTVVGMHFVVIKSGSNGNYTIHDPWFGSDISLNDHYSTGLIMSLRLITQ